MESQVRKLQAIPNKAIPGRAIAVKKTPGNISKAIPDIANPKNSWKWNKNLEHFRK